MINGPSTFRFTGENTQLGADPKWTNRATRGTSTLLYLGKGTNSEPKINAGFIFIAITRRTLAPPYARTHG
ncbi:MAG: hypothetical protein ACKOUM_05875 [Sphingopyxis sp.]